MTQTSPTRRTIIGTVAGTLTALAGCSDTSPSGTSSSPFQNVAVEGSAVVVTLVADSSVERVNLINPEGRSIGSSKVVSGETRVEFDLGTSYTPGEFDVVAEPTGETSIEIRPDIEIQNVGVGANHLDKMPDGLGNTQSKEALVVVENLGNGPDSIRALTFSGDVPNPTEDVRKSESKSGIFDAQEGKGERTKVDLDGQEKVVLYSSTLPFSLAAEGKNCESMQSPGEIEIHIFSSVAKEPSIARFGIQYSPTDSDEDCAISIENRLK